jgi:hypothetical protein
MLVQLADQVDVTDKACHSPRGYEIKGNVEDVANCSLRLSPEVFLRIDGLHCIRLPTKVMTKCWRSYWSQVQRWKTGIAGDKLRFNSLGTRDATEVKEDVFAIYPDPDEVREPVLGIRVHEG